MEEKEKNYQDPHEEHEELEELKESEEYEEEGSDLLSILIVSAGILIVAVALILVVLVVVRPFGGNSTEGEAETESESVVQTAEGQVAVPDITGMTEDEAAELLSSYSLGLKYTGEASSEVAAGLILSQEPQAGELAEENATVTYIRSSGPSYTVMPDVTGMRLYEATKELRDLGFEQIDIVSERGDDTDAGYVISTSPEEDERAEKNGEVTLVVSGGDESGSVTVGDYTGLSLNRALRSIASDGLIVDLRYGRSDLHDEDEVMGQDLQPYASVAAGSVITLIVSEGEPEATLFEGEEIATLLEPDTYDDLEAYLVLELEKDGIFYEVLLTEEGVMTFPYEVTVPVSTGGDGRVIRMYSWDGDEYKPIAYWSVDG